LHARIQSETSVFSLSTNKHKPTPMHYPNKPHFKIFTTLILTVLQYYFINSEFISTQNEQGQIASFLILSVNAALLSATIGSTTFDIKKQLQQELKHDFEIVKDEIVKIENSFEEMEQVVLNNATLLLGTKVYRPNPILARFDSN
jgi:hypothetical protein